MTFWKCQYNLFYCLNGKVLGKISFEREFALFLWVLGSKWCSIYYCQRLYYVEGPKKSVHAGWSNFSMYGYWYEIKFVFVYFCLCYIIYGFHCIVCYSTVSLFPPRTSPTSAPPTLARHHNKSITGQYSPQYHQCPLSREHPTVGVALHLWHLFNFSGSNYTPMICEKAHTSELTCRRKFCDIWQRGDFQIPLPHYHHCPVAATPFRIIEMQLF